MSKEIQVIEKAMSKVVEKAKALKISDAKTMEESAEMLSQCNLHLDALEHDRKTITGPMNTALKEVNAKYKPAKTILESSIKALRDEQSRYQTEMVKKQREEEAKIATKIKPGKGNLSIEKGIEKLDGVEKAEEKVVVDSGSLNFKEVATLKITDEKKIPRAFLIVNEKLLLESLKAGTSVPGAEIELIQQPINRRA